MPIWRIKRHVQAHTCSNRRIAVVIRRCSAGHRLCPRDQSEGDFFFAKPDYPVAFYGEGALIDPTTPDKFAEIAEQQAREILAAHEAAAKAEGVVSAGMSSVSDIPYEAIIAAAEEAGADLIFMASHGRRGISGLLLGSETQKVLTHSKIPVLVYR